MMRKGGERHRKQLLSPPSSLRVSKSCLTCTTVKLNLDRGKNWPSNGFRAVATGPVEGKEEEKVKEKRTWAYILFHATPFVNEGRNKRGKVKKYFY